MTDIREVQEEEAQQQPQEPQLMPYGSTVVQCVLEEKDGEPNLVVNGLIIGGGDYDDTNPCHRFLAVLADRLPSIMAEIGEWKNIKELTQAAANDDAAADAAIAG